MNEKRRKKIVDVISQLQSISANLYDIQDEEQSCFDSLPEGLQSSERGEKMSEDADTLCAAADDAESIADTLYEIIE